MITEDFSKAPQAGQHMQTDWRKIATRFCLLSYLWKVFFLMDNIDILTHFFQCFICQILNFCNFADVVKKLQDMAPRYDYDKLTPGNGFRFVSPVYTFATFLYAFARIFMKKIGRLYRSLVCVCDTIVLHLISVLRSCIQHRQTMIFRASYYCKEVESYCAVLNFLVSAFQMVCFLFRIALHITLSLLIFSDCRVIRINFWYTHLGFSSLTFYVFSLII